jgi:hypothetical protein
MLRESHLARKGVMPSCNGNHAAAAAQTMAAVPRLTRKKSEAPSVDGASQVTRSSVKLYAIETLINRAECVTNNWS